MSLFKKLAEGLKHSSQGLKRGTASLFKAQPTGHAGVAPPTAESSKNLREAPPQDQPIESPLERESNLRRLEESLLSADLGVAVVDELLGSLRKRARYINGERECRRELAEMLRRMLENSSRNGLISGNEEQKPFVALFVGTNGSGKTTTIGKLSAHLRKLGKKVVLAAGDTFRAAASEQLAIWAKKTDSLLVASKTGADPASVAFEGWQRAKAERADYLFIDTAGRQHTNLGLMAELEKLKRVLAKLEPSIPHLSLLVIDANTGINATTAATEFKNGINPDALIVTKLDTEAKGGAVVNLWRKLKIPIYALGIGEKEDEWLEFEPRQFVTALLGD